MGAHVPAAGPARPPRLHDPRPRSGPRRGSRCRLDRGRRVARRAARVVVAARSGARLPRRAGRRRGPAGRRSAAVGGRRDHHADRRRRRGEGRRLRADPDGAPGRRGGRGPRRLARHRAGDRGPHRGRISRRRPAGRRATSSPRSGRRSARAATRSAPRSARRSTSRASRSAISTAGSCRRNRRAPRTSSTCGGRTAISSIAAGLDPANVHVAGLCTATHNDWFWSYRREGARAGRMLAVIRRRVTPAPQARLRGTARTSRSSAWRTRLTSVSDVNGFSSRSTLRPSCSPRLPG